MNNYTINLRLDNEQQFIHNILVVRLYFVSLSVVTPSLKLQKVFCKSQVLYTEYFKNEKLYFTVCDCQCPIIIAKTEGDVKDKTASDGITNTFVTH